MRVPSVAVSREAQEVLPIAGKVSAGPSWRRNVKVKKRRFHFPVQEWVDDPDAVVLACGECSALAQSFCELYHQMKTMELLLQWKVWTVRRIMSLAGKVPSRVKGFREAVKQGRGREEKENSGRLLDGILEFRRGLVKKCARKLQNATPKVSLIRCQSENDSKKRILEMTTSTENRSFEDIMALPVSSDSVEDVGTNLREENHPKQNLDPDTIRRVKICSCAIAKRVRKSIRLARNRRILRKKLVKRQKTKTRRTDESASANKLAPVTFPVCRYLNIFKSSSSSQSQSVKGEEPQNQCGTTTTTVLENNDEVGPSTAEESGGANNLIRNSPSPNPNQSFSLMRLPTPSSSTFSESSKDTDKDEDEWLIAEGVTSDQPGEIRPEISVPEMEGVNICANDLARDLSMLELELAQENSSAPIPSSAKVSVEKLANENLSLCSPDCELKLPETSTKYEPQEPETEEHCSENYSADCVLDGSVNIVVEHIDIDNDDDLDDYQKSVEVRDSNEEALAAEIILIDVEEQAGIEEKSVPIPANRDNRDSSLIEIESNEEQPSNSNEEISVGLVEAETSKTSVSKKVVSVSTWVPPIHENENDSNEDEKGEVDPPLVEEIPTDLQISRLRAVYRCQKCTRTFSTPGKLEEHQQSYHAETKSDDESESDYYNDDSDDEEESEPDQIGTGRRETRASSSKSSQKIQPQPHSTKSSADVGLTCKVGDCSEELYSEEDYDNHQKLHGKFPCLFCDSVQDYAPDLAWHEIQTHSDELTTDKIKKWVAHNDNERSGREAKSWGKLFRCPRPNCSYRIGRKRDYISHHVTKHEDLAMDKLSHTCKICKFVWAQKGLHSVRYDMKRHFDTHHNIDRLSEGESVQRCDQKDCEAYFLTPLQLDVHKTKFHGIKKIHQCADCPIRYACYRNLCAHRQREHPAKRSPTYCCSFKGCQRSFETEVKLKSHVNFMHTKKMTMIPCTECKKVFRGKSQLTLHMKKHTNPKKKDEKRFVCEQCGKAFKKKAHLDVHYLSHSGPESWKFMCSVCPKKCLTKSKLTQHMRTHVEEKPYVCDHCGEKYAHRHNLRNHVNSKHGDKVQDLPKKYGKTNLTSRNGVKRKWDKNKDNGKSNLDNTDSSNFPTRRSKRSRKTTNQADM